MADGGKQVYSQPMCKDKEIPDNLKPLFLMTQEMFDNLSEERKKMAIYVVESDCNPANINNAMPTFIKKNCD